MRVVLIEPEATEEADGDSGAGGRVRLLAAHRVEDRLARVLGRPDGRIPGGGHLPLVDRRHELAAGDRARIEQRRLPAFRAGLGPRELPPEVALVSSSERRVGVGAADQAEAVRVRTDIGLQADTELEGRAHVLVGEPLVPVRLLHTDVGRVPGLVVGELVLGRQIRMRFAVALVLGGLDDRLEVDAPLRVLSRQWIPGGVLHPEHQAAGEVAVVRDREHRASGAGLVLREERPQVLGVVAVERAERNDPARAPGAVAEDHVAMKVVAVRRRRVLVADERGEMPRIVVALRVLDDLRPDGLLERLAVDHVDVLEQRLPELGEHDGRVLRETLRPARARLGRQQQRVPTGESREHAEILGVVAHDEEVERTSQLNLHAVVRGQHRAPCEAVGIVRRELLVAEEVRVRRQRRVQVCVAPVDLTRELLRGIGRVGLGAAGQRPRNRRQSEYEHPVAHRFPPP